MARDCYRHSANRSMINWRFAISKESARFRDSYHHLNLGTNLTSSRAVQCSIATIIIQCLLVFEEQAQERGNKVS